VFTLVLQENGNWTFTVTDSANNDIGSIRAVTLEVTGFIG